MNCETLMKKDRALYVDLEDALAGGRARLVADEEVAVLARYNDFPLYILGAADAADGKRLLDGVSEPEFGVVLRGEALAEYAREKGMKVSDPCWQVCYNGPRLDASGPLDIRRPSPEDFAAVAETYTLVPVEELREDFAGENFYCGYLDGALAAYAGVHSEGSLGMLHVFEKYRGRGLSKQMSRFMINSRLDKGRLPYAHVFCDNTVSLELQRRTGMVFSNQIITWARSAPREKR